MMTDRCPLKACKGFIEADVHYCSLCIGTKKARTMAELDAHVVKRHANGGNVETAGEVHFQTDVDRGSRTRGTFTFTEDCGKSTHSGSSFFNNLPVFRLSCTCVCRHCQSRSVWQRAWCGDGDNFRTVRQEASGACAVSADFGSIWRLSIDVEIGQTRFT